MGTIMESKENNILELFFNQPTKHWHFEEIIKEAKIARSKAAGWLTKFIKENLIKRIKPEGKMPYYISNNEHPHYKNTKRIFALTKLHESGLLDYLASIEKAESIILFGSFSRSDWYQESDIDLFVYGNLDEMFLGKYMAKLKREIQVFNSKDKKDLKKIGGPLLRNILKGIIIKGTIPQEVFANASV